MQALQQITSSSARGTLEWHMDQHDAGLVGTLCLDHIALPPQAHHRLMASHFDLASDEASSDEDMEVNSHHTSCLKHWGPKLRLHESLCASTSRLHTPDHVIGMLALLCEGTCHCADRLFALQRH